MRILHVFRSPVGGLFRHVRDLVRGQQALGHAVGILCDGNTGGPGAVAALENLKPYCSLGITRVAMSMLPGLGDLSGVRNTVYEANALNADVIHGHGAKGGLYARLAAQRLRRVGVYTPHGGSLHFDWGTFPGSLYLVTEWALRKTNGGLCFVCNFERDLFARKIGLGNAPHAVVYNGLWPEEFVSVSADRDATDFLFVGEMRRLKGVDLLLQAVATLEASLTLVGDGPDFEAFKAQARALGLGKSVRFMGRLSMAQALPLGRILVLPSRNEAFPYVVLEAVAAAKTMIATKVGGVPEILPDALMCGPDDLSALQRKLQDTLEDEPKNQHLMQVVSGDARTKFSAPAMAVGVCGFYERLALTNPLP